MVNTSRNGGNSEIRMTVAELEALITERVHKALEEAGIRRAPKKKSFVGPSGSSFKKTPDSKDLHHLCSRCELHHPRRYCAVLCTKCNRKGHIAKNCRVLNPASISAVKAVDASPSSSNACFNCGKVGHRRAQCPELKSLSGSALICVYAPNATKVKDEPSV